MDPRAPARRRPVPDRPEHVRHRQRREWQGTCHKACLSVCLEGSHVPVRVQTVLLRHLISLVAGDKGVHCTAMTGMAAQALPEGTTLHKFAGLGLAQGEAKGLVQGMKYPVQTRWRSARILVIDEVSMLDAELFEKFDQVRRSVSGRAVRGGASPPPPPPKTMHRQVLAGPHCHLHKPRSLPGSAFARVGMCGAARACSHQVPDSGGRGRGAGPPRTAQPLPLPLFHMALHECCLQIARTVRRSKKLWGGIQLVMFGDFLQLPPVNAAGRDGLPGGKRMLFQSELFASEDVAKVGQASLLSKTPFSRAGLQASPGSIALTWNPASFSSLHAYPALMASASDRYTPTGARVAQHTTTYMVAELWRIGHRTIPLWPGLTLSARCRRRSS